MAAKKKSNPIKGVAAKADVKPPLKPMHQAPIEQPKPHVPGKAEGAKPKAVAHPKKSQGSKRPRNKSR